MLTVRKRNGLGVLGLRVSEACAIDIEHLGSERGHRTVTVIGKGAKVAVIPLPPPVARSIDLAAAWALEHGPAGSRWRRADKVELSGPEGGAIPLNTDNVREDLMCRIAQIRDRITPQGQAAHNGNGTVSVPAAVHSPDA